MLFSSPLFLFVFFPAFFSAYLLLPWRRVTLALASLLFYAWGEPEFIFVVLAAASLDWQLGKQFSQVEQFFYRGLETNVYEDGAPVKLGEAVDCEEAASQADAVLVELNEVNLVHPDYLIEFGRTLLSRSQSDREPGPLRNHRYLKPSGERVDFSASAASALAPYLTGFTPPEADGAWSDQSLASLRLQLPPPGPYRLRLRVKPNLLAGQPPVRLRLLSDESLGEWKLDSPDFRDLECTLPAAQVAADGTLTLYFQVLHANSLRSLGTGDDPRSLGIKLATLQVEPIRAPASRWQTLPLRQPLPMVGFDRAAMSGFSKPEASWVWTEGSPAQLQLKVPLQGLRLAFEVSAYRQARLLPSQVVRIYANDHLADNWVFHDDQQQRRVLAIDPGWLDSSGRLTLRFRLARTCAPSQTSGSQDNRQLGLRFRSLEALPANSRKQAPCFP